jgi:hypothetical protein
MTTTLGGGEWSASRPGRFTARERAPRIHCIGGWVGTRAGLDAWVRRKIPSSYLYLYQLQNPLCSVCVCLRIHVCNPFNSAALLVVLHIRSRVAQLALHGYPKPPPVLMVSLQCNYEGVSKSYRTGRRKRELQMVQLCATKCSCIAIL